MPDKFILFLLKRNDRALCHGKEWVLLRKSESEEVDKPPPFSYSRLSSSKHTSKMRFPITIDPAT